MCQLSSENEGYFFGERQRIQLEKKLNVNALLEKALNQLYDDRKIDKATGVELTRMYFEPLSQAVNEGYGKSLGQLEYNSPNYEFLKALQTNTAVFAAFKNHSAIREFTGLLKDENGNLRSRDDFKREALKINADYQGYKLDAEYDTAVRQARMAANWQQYEKKQKLYPNLRYVQTRAANPDEAHLKFVGIVRPVNDPFWNTHYPPNRWRCQCSVQQTDDTATDLPDNLPPVHPDFRFNSGKTQQVFDLENSDYIKSVPAKERPALIREAKKLVNREAAIKQDFQPLYSSRSGKTVTAHPLAFDASDFEENLREGRVIANQGSGVKILPITTDPALRPDLMPKGAKGLHCPDFEIEKVTLEMKTLSKATGTAIRGAIERAYEQCDGVMINIPKELNMPLDLFKRHLRGKLNSGYKGMTELWISWEGKWYKTSREKILQHNWPF